MCFGRHDEAPLDEGIFTRTHHGFKKNPSPVVYVVYVYESKEQIVYVRAYSTASDGSFLSLLSLLSAVLL